MKYLNDYNTQLIESIKTNKLNISKYNNIYVKLLKDLNLNFYYITTIGTAIPVLFPIFENVIKNKNNINISIKDIVLLTTCSVAIIVDENKSDIEKMKNIIAEKNYDDILSNFTSFLNNINKIFVTIIDSTDQIFNNTLELISYTEVYTPFLIGLLDLIKTNKLNIDNFNDDMFSNGVVIDAGIGTLTISFKKIIESLLLKIKELSNIKKV